MIPQKIDSNYYYDPCNDIVNFYFDTSAEFFSEEKCGILLIKDEYDEKLIGLEIMNVSKWGKKYLLENIPEEVRQTVSDIFDKIRN